MRATADIDVGTTSPFFQEVARTLEGKIYVQILMAANFMDTKVFSYLNFSGFKMTQGIAGIYSNLVNKEHRHEEAYYFYSVGFIV